MQHVLNVDDVLSNPDLFLFDIVRGDRSDSGAPEARFVRSSKEAYDRAGFLKLGEFEHEDAHYDIRLETLTEAIPKDTAGGVVHHIFNTGFCCSTLLARAVGALGPFLVLREPQAMDALDKLKAGVDPADVRAAEGWRDLLRTVLFLLGRNYAGMSCSIAKADEFSGRLQRDLLGVDPRSKALFLYSALQDFIPAILKSPRRRAYVHEKVRLHEGDIDFLLPFSKRAPLTDAEAAALSWLYEQYNYLELVSSFGEGRVSFVTAEEFLREPARVLMQLAAWFGTPVSAETADAVASSSVMKTHAKSSEREFDVASRQEVLKSVSTSSRAEVEAGLRFAAEITGAHPLPRPLPGGVTAR